MCLAIPARVIALTGPDQAVVDLGGIRKPVNTALVPDAAVGDYLIVHVGHAIGRIELRHDGKAETGGVTISAPDLAFSQYGLQPDDLVFFRPTQSESVLQQFGDIAVVEGDRVVAMWPVFPARA